MKRWTLTEARRNLEQLFDTAMTGEMQILTRYKKPVLVAIPYEIYQQLVEAKKTSQGNRDDEIGITAKGIIDAVRESRERDFTNPSPENQEE